MATAVAVLAGALAVGTSVRTSLADLSKARLGATEYALISSGTFSEKLASEAPYIALEAVVTHDESNRRASRVMLYGVDARFFQFHQRAVESPTGDQFLLSPTLAQELGAKPGDSILVRTPRVSAIPTESLHGRKDDPGRTIRGSMREVISRDAMGEFSLQPQAGPVRAIFVSLQRLQHDLELDGRVNMALSNRPTLREDIKTKVTLNDLGIRLRPFSDHTILEHQSMLLTGAQLAAVRKVHPNAQPAFSYLANVIRAGSREVPYSLVTAMDQPEIKADDEIVLNDWAAKDLGAKVGDPITITYYLWDAGGRLLTREASFRLSAVVFLDPTTSELAPEYPGISNANSMTDWDPPFPMELGKIRPVDEEYWNRYRATPKAFISLAAGQKLWRSRFGEATSVRIPGNVAPDQLTRAFDPFASGLTVRNVAEEAGAASGGSTDFSEYFLYFSFFLIASAVLLTAMFFKLGIEQRAPEIRTLRAVGFSSRDLRGLFLREGLLIALAGTILGLLGARLYAGFIIEGLRSWWNGAVGTRELYVSMTPGIAVIGFIAGLAIAAISILLALRHKKPRPVGRKPRPLHIYAGAGFVLAIGLLFVGGVGGFFGSGALLLASAMMLFSWWLQRRGKSLHNLRELAAGYASHRSGRSVLCAALIASAAFMVIATDAFRRSGVLGDMEYRYFAESAIPLFYDPNTPEGREALNLPESVKSRWLSFRLRPGDDASCLNLYQPVNPRIVGVPPAFAQADWKLGDIGSDGTIPAAVDANSLTYVLHRKVGDVIEVGGAKLRVVSTLRDSVFQSEILISARAFERAFPEEQGYRVFLIDAPQGSEGEIENALGDFGLDITPAAARIEAYHEVENTYLTTFQMLGMLGLVLGTVGLAAILLRNVLERRRELALLEAAGYTRNHLRQLLLWENLLLLAVGLGVGIVAALAAVIPAAMERGGSPPLQAIAILVLSCAVVGYLASAAALAILKQSKLLDSLRAE